MKFTRFVSLLATAGVVSASPVTPPSPNGVVGALPVAPPIRIARAAPVAPPSPNGVVGALPVAPPIGIVRAAPVAPPSPPAGIVPVSPGAILPGGVARRCGACDADSHALDLMDALKTDIKDKLAMLGDCRTTGKNPTDIFNKLIGDVDQYKIAMEGINSTSSDSRPGVQAHTVGMAAQMILDIGNEYSKFANVRMDGFDYPALSYKTDIALKEYCYALDGLMKGSLGMISAMCLPNALTLWAANMKNCLSTFATNLV